MASNIIQILDVYWREHPTWFGRSFGEYLHLGANQEMLRLILQGISIDPQTRVLDLGTALGGNARWLAALFGCKVEGIDPFKPAILAARQLAKVQNLGELCHFTTGELSPLPFADATFDLAVTSEGEVEWPEVGRVVKPGGFAVGTSVAVEGITPLLRQLEAAGFVEEQVIDVTDYALAFYRAKEAEARLLVAGGLMRPEDLSSLQMYTLDLYEAGGARHALFRVRRA
jgi:SAM-dependent methyltransferase